VKDNTNFFLSSSWIKPPVESKNKSWNHIHTLSIEATKALQSEDLNDFVQLPSIRVGNVDAVVVFEDGLVSASNRVLQGLV
jgi:hypothetical protein